MKKALLGVVLGGLLLAVTGCGGGGGGSSSSGGGGGSTSNVNLGVQGNYPINLLYQKSVGTNSTITFAIKSIDVLDNKQLKFNCTWSAQVGSPDVYVEKAADESKMYIQDGSGKKYSPKTGVGEDGAAYDLVKLNNGDKADGAYFFDFSGVTSNLTIYFHDDDQSKTLGPITIAVGTNNSANSSLTKQTIEQYFNEYFSAQKSLNYTKMSNIVEDNENTKINEEFRAMEIETKKILNTGISGDYKFNIDYNNISTSGDVTNVDLILDLDYHYAQLPANIKSGMYGVKYHFELKSNGSKLMITKIDSDLDEYLLFKEKVKAKTTSSSAQNIALSQIRQELRYNAQMVRQNGNSGTTFNTQQNINTPNAIVQSVYATYTSYTPSNGVAYAAKYALTEPSERIFYTAYERDASGNIVVDEKGKNVELDCTNFVSQCVWAGFGGYVSGNDSKNRSNIQNKVSMVNGVWQGGLAGGGGTDSWASVEGFWNYITSSKTAGPVGTGVNNKGEYKNIEESSIKLGDVLQITNDTGKYTHSMYVTEKKSNVSNNYQNTAVSYHSTNRWNRLLSEVLVDYKYMRKISINSPCTFGK